MKYLLRFQMCTWQTSDSLPLRPETKIESVWTEHTFKSGVKCLNIMTSKSRSFVSGLGTLMGWPWISQGSTVWQVQIIYDTSTNQKDIPIEHKHPVWWMRVGIKSLLSSISAFYKEFKLHTVYWTLFWVFGADKTSTTHWSGGRVQAWVQVRAPASHLAITPEGYSRRQLKVLTAKSIAKLLGPRSRTAWESWTGKHKHSSNRLAWGKRATTFAIVTQFETQKGSDAL